MTEDPEALAEGEKVRLWLWLLRSPQSSRPCCPQPPYRRTDQDQGFQGSRLQGRQGSQGQRQQVSNDNEKAVFTLSCKRGRSTERPVFLFKALSLRLGQGTITGQGWKGGERTMRLDKYLKVSRIIKRRTVANEACSEACKRQWSRRQARRRSKGRRSAGDPLWQPGGEVSDRKRHGACAQGRRGGFVPGG